MSVMTGIGKLFLAVAAGAVLAVGAVNAVVCRANASDIVDGDGARALDADCILALGAAVRADGTLSHMLQDRLEVTAELYRTGVAPKVIVSGNGDEGSNDEPTAMKAYLVKLGVAPQDIVCDGYGLNTYDSMWRARNVFGVNRIVIVTQAYHEYRALFIAKGVGMEARGVPSDLRPYAHQAFYDFREVFARVKDAGQVLIGATSTVQGDAVSLDITGEVTV